MKTIREIFLLSCEYLKKKKVQNYKYSAETILAKSLGYKRLDLYLFFDEIIEDKKLDDIRGFLKRRTQEPLEYIFPEIEFFGCSIKIDENVLIPRQETEQLVDIIIKELSLEKSLENKNIWDIGTGSGCIAVAIKKNFPSLKVFASDISKEAILTAKKNALKNNLDITFFLGDLLDPFSGNCADFIVSNPPYVSKKEYEEVSSDVKKEPKLALLAEDGLFYYRKLEKEMPDYLKKGAKIFFEIGHLQKKDIFCIFSKKYWKEKRVIKDFYGKDRFFFLEFN